jgi:hypothetical protein
MKTTLIHSDQALVVAALRLAAHTYTNDAEPSEVEVVGFDFEKKVVFVSAGYSVRNAAEVQPVYVPHQITDDQITRLLVHWRCILANPQARDADRLADKIEAAEYVDVETLTVEEELGGRR